MNPKFKFVKKFPGGNAYSCELILPRSVDPPTVFRWLEQKQAQEVVFDREWVGSQKECWVVVFLTTNQRLIRTLENRCKVFSSPKELPEYKAWEKGSEEDEDEAVFNPYEEEMTQLAEQLSSDGDNYTRSQTDGWFYDEPNISLDEALRDYLG